MYRHRTSIDLDAFSNSNFDNDLIDNALKVKFEKKYDLRVSSKLDIQKKSERFFNVDNLTV